MGQHFHVLWEIDIYAETPREAAQQAFDHMQRLNTTATYFEVFDQDGNKTNVDLMEDSNVHS